MCDVRQKVASVGGVSDLRSPPTLRTPTAEPFQNGGACQDNQCYTVRKTPRGTKTKKMSYDYSQIYSHGQPPSGLVSARHSHAISARTSTSSSECPQYSSADTARLRQDAESIATAMGKLWLLGKRPDWCPYIGRVAYSFLACSRGSGSSGRRPSHHTTPSTTP